MVSVLWKLISTDRKYSFLVDVGVHAGGAKSSQRIKKKKKKSSKAKMSCVNGDSFSKEKIRFTNKQSLLFKFPEDAKT